MAGAARIRYRWLAICVAVLLVFLYVVRRQQDRRVAQLSSAPGGEAFGVASDASGVYLTGVTQGALSGQLRAGGQDALARKYDANGNQRWTRQFGTAGQDWVYGVVADGTSVYVAGSVIGALPEQQSAGGQDAFARKYDTEMLSQLEFCAKMGIINTWFLSLGSPGKHHCGFTIWDHYSR